MNPAAPSPAGIVESLRALADLALASARDRLALLAVEWEEERRRLIQTLVWVSAAIFAGVMAIAFASLTLVYVFWDTARVAVLAGLAGFYGLMLALIVIGLRRMSARQARPFSATLAEIEEDRRCLRPEHSRT